MDKTPLTIAVGIAYMSLTASAQVRDSRLLAQHIAALSGAGFSGMADIKVPLPPTVKSFLVANEADQRELIKEALTSLSRETQGKREIEGEVIRKMLGPESFTGDFLVAQGRDVDRSDPNKPRFFSVANFRGKTEIILSQVDKGKKIVRTYLTTLDGGLVAAATTLKVNGQFQVEKTPNPVVEEDFKAELAFWKDYYLTRIKVEKST